MDELIMLLWPERFHFEYLGYRVIEVSNYGYFNYEVYHNGHFVSVYDSFDEAINSIPFSEYF